MKILLAIVVLLNGKLIKFKDAKPFIKNGLVMVPLRGVFEKVARVDLLIGGTTIRKGGLISTINGPSFKRNGRIFIPLRFIAETLGAKVNWNNATRTASITMKDEPTPGTPPAIKAGEIEMKISSDKTSYRAGEPVKFTLTATNQDDKPREITFPSGQDFEISILPKGQNAPIWNWSFGRMFAMHVRTKTLAPGETLTFNATWKQTDNDGKPAPRGEYSVAAHLATNPRIEAAPLSIQLTD